MNTSTAVANQALGQLLPVDAPNRQGLRLQLARELAKSRNIPAGFQNSPADIYMLLEVCEYSNLLFPLAVWECSLIRGRVMFGGKLCAAMLHNSGRLAERLSYTWTGEGEHLTVTVRARLHGESEPRMVDAVLKNARTPNNENWTKDPRQQLAYFGARKWGRLHLPEVLLGAVFDGETIDVTPHVIEPRAITPTMSQDQRSAMVDAQTQDNMAQTTARNTEPKQQNDELVPHVIPLDTQLDAAAAWSHWATELMAFIRAAPDADTINNWTTENFDHLANLQKYDSTKSAKLIDMINHQIELKSAAETT